MNPPRLAVWPTLSLDECDKITPENAAQFRKIVNGLTGDALERGITYKNSAGEQYTSTLEDILTHVFMHGSYHRGQIASLIRAAGDTPAPTDYIFFSRGSPAATRRI